MRLALTILALACGIGTTVQPRSIAGEPPIPLVRAHSHNDYEHARPLLDALDHGFCSVEADIHLVDAKLLVAHDRDEAKPDRTLQALYLDPLRDRVRENGGRVYKQGPPVILLIDIKTEAEATYLALREVLRQYTEMLTRFSSGAIQTNAVTVVISGNRARGIMAEEPVRFAGLDGRPADLEGGAPKDLIPLVSEDWKRLFRWRGEGPLLEAENARLKDLVSKAHAQGRKIRFWGTPDRQEVWRELVIAGVDLVNADNLSGLREFLTRN